MSEQTTLRDAAGSLWESFFRSIPGMHPYIQSIGTSDDTIWCYLVRKPMHHERAIPKTWEGWPVKTRVVGRITIGGGNR